jgi:hypothetical protein
MFSFIKNVWSDLVALNAPEPIQNISPDAMIAAGLMQSFASEFDDWSAEGQFCKEAAICVRIGRQPDSTVILSNKKKRVTIKFRAEWKKGRSRDGDHCNPWYYHNQGVTDVEVNDQHIDFQLGQQMYAAWADLCAKHKAAEEAAAKALAEMKTNEAKWNIAEQILGMKRTKSGRLIAVSSYCAVCDASEPDKEAEKLHNLSCPNRPQPKPRRPKVIKQPFEPMSSVEF